MSIGEHYSNCPCTVRPNHGLHLVQETEYPWSGDVRLTVSPETPTEFTVYLRIPGWSAKNIVHVNGEAIAGAQPGQYLAIRRHWSSGDRIQLAFDMTTQILEANPAVAEDVGKLAIQRGPIVFCMEGLDQKTSAQFSNISDFRAHKGEGTKGRYDADLLGGVYVLEHPGSLERDEALSLYTPANAVHVEEKSATLALIPYYAWANRTPAPMQVWITAQG